MARVKHTRVVTVPDNPAKQVSAAAWNEEHELTGTANTMLGFDSSGAAVDRTPSDAKSALGLGTAADADVTTLISKAEGSADTGFTLFKHKRAGTGTYARTAAQLEAVGGHGDDNIMHWVDPAYDEALIDGTSTADLTSFITNAVADYKAAQASSGRRQRLFVPALDLYHASPLLFDCPDLVFDAHGAKLICPDAAFESVYTFNGAGMEVHGLRAHLTAGAGAENYASVGAANVHLYGFELQRDATAHVPFYLSAASGFRWIGGKLDAYGGINMLGYAVNDVLIDGVAFVQPDSFVGTDDAIAIKATMGNVENFRVSNSYFRNKADFVGLGTQIGSPGANDPNRSFGVYGVTLSNLTGDNCGTILFIKPGAIFDTRDGVVRGVLGDNLKLRDASGTMMSNPIECIPDKGALVQDVLLRNVMVSGRSNNGGSLRAGILDINIADSTGVGAHVTTVERFRIEADFHDPYDGAAAGGAAPGSPAPALINVEKATSYGNVNDVVVSVTGNGTHNSGVSVGANLDNSVYVERLHATNIDTDGSSNFGGIVTASIVNASTDIDVTMAAGSSGRVYVNSGTGEVRTRAKFVGKEPKITLKSKAGTGGLAKGSISFTDDSDAEYGYLGDRDAANTVLTLHSADVLALSAVNEITLDNKFTQTTANLTNTITNSSGSPNNTPLVQLNRSNNISAPANTGAALSIVDHSLNYSLVIKDTVGGVKFSVGPSGDTAIGGALTATNLSGTNTGDQTITLAGDLSGSGTGSITATITAGAVTLSKMANLAANSILGNNTGSPATPVALTPAQVKSLLAIANTDVSGLGTASTKNTGTSGTTVPLLDGANTWSALQTLNAGSLVGGSTMVRVESTGGAAPSGASGAGLEITSNSLTAYNRTTDAYAALSVQGLSIALRVSGGTVGNVTSSGLLMVSPLGYGTGAGATVTQLTNRTTGVTVNAVCGKITLVSAAGSSSWNSFTVTNSQVAATDVIILNQLSGANLYNAIVTNVGSGSFKVSVSAVSGTATEAPAFNFAVIKAVTS